MKKLSRTLIVALLFIVGALGGVWAQAALFPYLSFHDSTKDMWFVRQWSERTAVIQQTTRLVVNESRAIEETIGKARQVTVQIRATIGTRVIESSGMTATSDGLIVGLSSLVPMNSVVEVVEYGPAEIVKRDAKTGYVLLRVAKTDMKTAGFGDLSRVSLGERVVAVGTRGSGEAVHTVAGEGIVSELQKNGIAVSMIASKNFEGSPVMDIEGRILGIASGSGATFEVFPVQDLRLFLGF